MTKQGDEHNRLVERLSAQFDLFKADAEVIGLQPSVGEIYAQLESMRKQLDSIQATYYQIEENGSPSRIF